MPQVTDSKGDTVAYPKAILSLPFTDQGNTYFFTDNYDYVCGSENSTASGGSKVRADFVPHEPICASPYPHGVLSFLLSF